MASQFATRSTLPRGGKAITDSRSTKLWSNFISDFGTVVWQAIALRSRRERQKNDSQRNKSDWRGNHHTADDRKAAAFGEL